MDTKHDIVTELEFRIQNDIKMFQGILPERYAIAWQGYLAGLMEWGVIDLAPYKRLLELLPPIADPNPVLTILSGHDDL